MERVKQSVVIAGGGSTYTAGIVMMLIENRDKFPLRKLKLYDNDKNRQEIIAKACEVIVKERAPEIEFVATTDPQIAFSDVDFVMAHIRAGGLKMREMDEKIPLKYGVVGQETCGPGGFAYGMRSIKAMIEMVNDIRNINTDAWILNYTNPAAIVALALDKVFPNDKRILNLCDQPYSMMRSYAKILNLKQSELSCKYFGLNHFGWFTDIYDKNGKSYLNSLKDYLKNNDFKPYNAEQRSTSWLETYKRVNKYLSFFPEYLPNTYLQYYFFPSEIVGESNPEYTRADEARDSREKEVFEMCENATYENSTILKGSVFGNLMVEVARSILYDLKDEFVIMTRNNNLITNFSNDAIVELVGKLGKDGVIVEKYGEIKPFYKGLMENQHAYEKLTVEACLEEDYDKAIEALTLNRTIIDPQIAKKVLDDLIDVNKGYWTLKKHNKEIK